MKQVLGILVGLFIVVAMEATIHAENATVAITGGSLSVTAANVTLSAVTLDGTDQIPTSDCASNNWSATDARGTGVGWNLTIDATDFTDGGTPLRTIDITSNDQEFKIRLRDAEIAVIAGNAKPTQVSNAWKNIPEAPAAPLKLVSAAGDTGMGSYALNPSFALEVPADTYVGTGTYTATMTVSAVSGP